MTPIVCPATWTSQAEAQTAPESTGGERAEACLQGPATLLSGSVRFLPKLPALFELIKVGFLSCADKSVLILLN